MKLIARLYKVEIQFDWHVEDEYATWHAATWEGAERLVKEEMNRKDQEVLWYSIEEQEFYPCEEDDPEGRLYIGIGRHKFEEFGRRN